MIDVELRLRNYRCFGDEPVSLRFRDGFTALLGVNNSGKSALLRVPYEIRPLIKLIIGNPQGWGTQLALGNDGLGHIWHPDVLSGERIARAGADRPTEIEFVVYRGPNGSFAFEEEPLVLQITYDKGSTRSALTTKSGQDLTMYRDGRRVEGVPSVDINPFLSAMRVLDQITYVGPFRNAINIGGHEAYYDIQVGEDFIRTFAGYKSGPSPEQNEAVYNLTQEIKRIFGFKSLDINPASDYKSLQLTVDGRSYRLSEQGAGLSHFIVVLANVLVRRPSFLLIDEPELNLHASLQLDFLQTLARYTDHGVIFATHSLGLARTVADHIYTLTKPVGGTSNLKSYGNDHELVTILGQLSFDRRPDLGFNKVLLVEGKSELRALAQFLRFYSKEHEILMIPLHGGEMIRGDVRNELSELLRIGGNVQYLIDSERTTVEEQLDKNRQNFVELCNDLEIRGHVLDRRALENYFPDAAVKCAFGPSASALGPYDKKGAGQNWPKTNNWRVALEMSRNDLDGTDLGDFLENL